MPLIEWQDRFSLGIASVDHEHREMVGLINTLYDQLDEGADHEEILEFLGEIYIKISSHFALEERVMREKNYAHYAEHKKDHEALLDEILEISDNFEEGDFGKVEGELAERLEKWFLVHFQTHDARLHKELEVFH